MRRLLALLGVLLTASPAWAAIAHVQSKNNATGFASTLNVTVTALTAGNLVTCITYSPSETITHSMSATGVTWATAIGPIAHSGAPTMRGYIFYGQVDSGGATTVTVTASSSTGIGAACIEASGLATSSPLDQTGSGEQSAATTHNLSASLTTTVADELLFGGCVNTGTASTWTVGTGYTGVSTVGGGTSPYAAYQIVASTGSYGLGSPTSTNAVDSVCLLATYKIASVAGGAASRSLLLNVGP